MLIFMFLASPAKKNCLAVHLHTLDDNKVKAAQDFLHLICTWIKSYTSHLIMHYYILIYFFISKKNCEAKAV